MTPTPKSEPVISATLLAPVIVWLVAYFWPGTEVSSEQATIAATIVLAIGSAVARSRVRPLSKPPAPSAEALLARRVRESQQAKAPPFEAP
jgi:hypothetical protein